MRQLVLGFITFTVLAPQFAWSVQRGQAQELPKLSLVLTPHMKADSVDYVDVVMTIESSAAEANMPFLLPPMHLPFDASGPFSPLDLVVKDSLGVVPTGTGASHDEDGNPAPITALRTMKGRVTVQYRAPTFAITKNPFPPYELRSEGSCIIGAGFGFLVIPAGKEVYRIKLHWNLAAMPADSMGVWSFGEGDVTRVGMADTLQRSFYAAGPLHHYSAGAFGLYFGNQPPFAISAIGEPTEKLFAYYKTFFHEDPDSYRVFFRDNRAIGSGSGAALMESFIFDYMATDPAFYRSHVAHEMAHTFLSLFEPVTGAWYAEGMAEYYSGVLSVRAGISTPDEFIAGVNFSASHYYPMPTRELPNAEIPDFVLGGTSQTKSVWRDQSAT